MDLNNIRHKKILRINKTQRDERKNRRRQKSRKNIIPRINRMNRRRGKSRSIRELTSAEIFKPQARGSCPVGELKQARSGHTMCNNMVCGGKSNKAEKSCEKFDGISTFTSLPVRLRDSREGHLCWGLKSGDVLLLGGTFVTSTERVSADGSSSSNVFELPYEI